jgi:hypothetical protein
MLKKHNMVTIDINAFGLDSWDNEYFMVSVDGKNIIK